LVQTLDKEMILTSLIQDVFVESKIDHWSLFVKQAAPNINCLT
jgi:hypothetical protein